jgi:16S rRNA (guanine(966)-N(2))-methyltransferase RsmD
LSSPRIIAGKAKGLRLQSVSGDSTRPITDRVKEALFNIIGIDIVDASFLDLFGGTGSVGIEALSRGASLARLIELNQAAVTTIKHNLEFTRLKDHGEVIHSDAFVYLKRPADWSFDYIYIAPPQYKNLWQKAILEIDANPGWLSEDAWVIVQIHPVEYEKLVLTHLDEFDQRKYGSTLLIFYEKKTA